MTDDFIEKGVEEYEIEVLNPTRPFCNMRTPVKYGELATLAEVESEPKTYKQTLKNTHVEQWKQAMSEEISSLTNHETWDLVDLPDGRNLVGCKWVYKAKCKADGKIDRLKHVSLLKAIHKKQVLTTMKCLLLLPGIIPLDVYYPLLIN